MVLIMKHFLYYPLGFRREGNQVKDISGLEESAKGGHCEHKKDRLSEEIRGGPKAKAFVTGDHGAVSASYPGCRKRLNFSEEKPGSFPFYRYRQPGIKQR